jgi:hypothetical protein
MSSLSMTALFAEEFQMPSFGGSGGEKSYNLGSTMPLSEEMEIRVIGFPRSEGPWAVKNGAISSLPGRNIFFSPAVDEGHSGGPIIYEGKVIGLVVGPVSYPDAASRLVVFTNISEVLGSLFKRVHLKNRPNVPLHRLLQQTNDRRNRVFISPAPFTSMKKLGSRTIWTI